MVTSRALTVIQPGGGSDFRSHAPWWAKPCTIVMKDDKSNGGRRTEGRCSRKMLCYRSQLEQEVKKLQRQLQEEIDLHVALANAVAHNAVPLLNSPTKFPDKVQELLANIASLENTVSKLEEELVALHSQLSHERNERLLAETQHVCLPSSTSGSTWEESISSLRNLKSRGPQVLGSSFVVREKVKKNGWIIATT